jgi:hypothetical protein
MMVIVYANHTAQWGNIKTRRIRASCSSHKLASTKNLLGSSYICAGEQMEVASYSHVNPVYPAY